jgi:hypothetical protein
MSEPDVGFRERLLSAFWGLLGWAVILWMLLLLEAIVQANGAIPAATAAVLAAAVVVRGCLRARAVDTLEKNAKRGRSAG